METTSLDSAEYDVSWPEDTDASELIDEVPDLPDISEFRGLDVRTLNHSTSNPLASLSRIALDAAQPLAERKQAFRYMYQSAYLDKAAVCGSTLLAILAEEGMTPEERFEWLHSIRLVADGLEVALHGYIFWFYTFPEPLTYKMLAAQFILSHPIQSYPMIRSHFKHAQNELYRIAKSDRPVPIRSEAADMLLRLGTGTFREAGERIIRALGESYLDHRQRTFYSNSQNAHEIRGVREAVESLVQGQAEPLDSIFTFLQGNDKAVESFQRIVLDTASYYGHSLADLFRHVFRRVKDSPHRQELERRVVEELVEMNGWCSTGHLVRLLNVLQGFDSAAPLSLDRRAEIRAAVFARLQFAMKKSCSAELQEELTLAFCSAEKEILLEFVETFSPYDELKREYGELPEFDGWFREAVDAYVGK
jgi:SAM-dependent methyltransferase